METQDQDTYIGIRITTESYDYMDSFCYGYTHGNIRVVTNRPIPYFDTLVYPPTLYIGRMFRGTNSMVCRDNMLGYSDLYEHFDDLMKLLNEVGEKVHGKFFPFRRVEKIQCARLALNMGIVTHTASYQHSSSGLSG